MQDEEGLQTMRTLARNMSFLIKSIALGKENTVFRKKNRSFTRILSDTGGKTLCKRKVLYLNHIRHANIRKERYFFLDGSAHAFVHFFCFCIIFVL